VIDLFDPPGDRPDEGYNRYGDGSNYCDYSLVVYSTQEFKDSISTNTALSFTLIVAGVSALVILTFLVYDCYVRRRNTKVVEAAVRSDQILMSHFPSNVRSRLYEAQQNQEKETSAARGIAAKSRLRHFLNGTETPGEATDTNKSPAEVLGFEGKPIADLYVVYYAFLSIMDITFFSPTLMKSATFVQVSRNNCPFRRHCGIYSLEQRTRACASFQPPRNAVQGF
jgi:hypothetical protein